MTPILGAFTEPREALLVIDLGRMTAGDEDSSYAQACVRKLMRLIVFGDE